jgi:hypothetical protein
MGASAFGGSDSAFPPPGGSESLECFFLLFPFLSPELAGGEDDDEEGEDDAMEEIGWIVELGEAMVVSVVRLASALKLTPLDRSTFLSGLLAFFFEDFRNAEEEGDDVVTEASAAVVCCFTCFLGLFFSVFSRILAYSGFEEWAALRADLQSDMLAWRLADEVGL